MGAKEKLIHDRDSGSISTVVPASEKRPETMISPTGDTESAEDILAILKSDGSDTAKQLNKKVDELEQALANSRTELRDILHDLNNMIGSAYTNLSFLRSMYGEFLESNQKINEIITDVESSIERATRFIRSINRSKEGNQIDGMISLSEFNISSLIHEVAQDFRNVTIQVQPGITIAGDSRKIAVLLANVIDNAIKFTDNPSLPIKITAEADEHQIEIQIEDCGPGILEEEIDNIFNRETRGSNVSNIEGTGLGLDICKKICKHHNGSISVQNNPDHIGCTFTITLPIKQT